VASTATIDVVGLLGGRPVGGVAEDAVRRAVLVVGGGDQLAGVADLLAPGVRTAVIGAGLGALDEVAAAVGPVCVLASGDPGCFGILRPLAARVGSYRLVVHPAPSSVALAFARLGLPSDDAVVRSCHRGGAARVAAEVAGQPVAAVLCGPDAPPEAVGGALVVLGASHRLVAVATRLGEAGETVTRCCDLAALAAGRFDPRSVVVLAHPEAEPLGLGGRPVAAFAHRGSMITKPEVRSVVLGKLCLPAFGVLWDVGAGSGSVAIEAALAAPGLRVIAVERGPQDAARILANAGAHGAVVEVVEGTAPGVLARLPAPDRVFVGGGGLEVLAACHAALLPGGRLVATFAAVDRAAQAHRLLGSLVQVGVQRADVLPDGGLRLVADNPVFVAWGDRPATAPSPPPGRLAIGVGCSSKATSEEVAEVVEAALALVHGAGQGSRSGEGGPVVVGFSGAAGRPGSGPPDQVTLNTDMAADPTFGPSEELRGQSRGGGSSEEAEDTSATGLVTLRSRNIADGAGLPQRRTRADAGSSDSAGADRGRGFSAASTPPTGLGGQSDSARAVVATIDARGTHPAVLDAAADRPILSFPASLLAGVEVPGPSEVVAAAVGTPSVAEAAALLAAGPGARLVVGKQRGPTATAAVAVGGRPPVTGRVQIVGLGPGHPSHRTPAAVAAVRGADAVLGYGPYVDAVQPLLRPDQLVVRSAMGAEADRALAALALARAGWQVALVSSGDPGVFAMASVTLELAAEHALGVGGAGFERPLGVGSAGPEGLCEVEAARIRINIVPGITASSAAAAAAGAPLAGPHAVLTLSDLLLPWGVIEAQLRAAATSGLALALYNPRSAGRPDHLDRARTVLLDVLAPSTPVAVVTAATDAGEQVFHTTLVLLDPTVAGMRSLVLVGTADSMLTGGRLITRRHHPRSPVAP